MRPLILEFAEKPELEELDFSTIQYSRDQNLAVLKGTNIPAISYLSMDTETFTKVQGESADPDQDLIYRLGRVLDTRTETLSDREPSDSDNDFPGLKLLIDTKTITESIEPTDSDK